ncbi:hypothetical protein P389DRAFT_195615 [Cystobasidium minutum MCA 4210]|uniref:mitochondrial 54S ribosomal protein bL35m n=1 Tax=Cystobasidium minutum MCA 4210 TaxID=1397322 RepID=UPI0034CFE50B|eukprot:jgi/Rhomi1/195615/gm1.3829_g
MSASSSLPARSQPSCCCSSLAIPSTSSQSQFLRQVQSTRQFSATSVDLAKVKLKTHKGAAKRWAALPSGQYKRGRPGKRHLNVTLSSEGLNRLGHTAYATPAQQRRLKKLLPGQ